MKKILLLLVSCLLTACSTDIPVPSAMPKITITNLPTSTPTIKPAEEPTPSPSPTEDIGFSEVEMFVLDAKIEAFLNKKSPYTEEEIQKTIIETNKTESILSKSEEKTKLGLVDFKSYGVCNVEGKLLDYLEKDESILIVVGFDGKDDDRFVTCMEIPVYLYENSDEFDFNFETLEISPGTGSRKFAVESTDGRRDNVLKYLDLLKNKTLIFSVDIKGRLEDEIDYYDDGSIVDNFVEENLRKIPYSQQLAYKVYNSGIIIPEEYNPKLGEVSLPNITSYGDVEKAALSEIPMVAYGMLWVK